LEQSFIGITEVHNGSTKSRHKTVHAKLEIDIVASIIARFQLGFRAEPFLRNFSVIIIFLKHFRPDSGFSNTPTSAIQNILRIDNKVKTVISSSHKRTKGYLFFV